MKRSTILMLSILILSLAATAFAQRGALQANQFQNNRANCPLGVISPTGDLSAVEAEWLTLMREEEKLARDVYSNLFQTWGVLVFRNIAGSEQRHFDAIGLLINRYGLQDPAADDVPGIFTNPELAALYADLTARGSASVAEAMRVGAAIEELDIRDLKLATAETDRVDILRVFGNLLRGSMNHLHAYLSHLQALGESYTAQYLDAETWNGILENVDSPGMRRRMGRR